MGREAWTTTKPGRDPMRASLVERARKRKVENGKSPGKWVVKGIQGLGDKYDEYLVADVDGTYTCDCHQHGHGEYRKRETCSHVTAVILHRQGKLGSKKVPNGFTPHVPPENEWQIDFKDPQAVVPTTDQPEVEVRGEVEAVIGDLVTAPEPSAFPLPSSISISAADSPMPEKFTEYVHEQWPTILQIMEAFEAGFKVVLLDAPTGSGKTLIAESVRRLMGVRGLYTCTTKTLQDQVMNPRDFGGYGKVVKGRRNYPTLNNPNATAEDCTKQKRSLPACEKCPGWTAERSWRTDKVVKDRKIDGQTTLVDLGDDDDEVVTYHCTNCHPWFKCPYEIAKGEAARARLAVLNTAYFLSENAFVRTTPFKNWPLVILDEADRLEEELMRFVEVEIGPRMRKNLKVGLPAKKGDDEEWVKWIIMEVIPAIEREIEAVSQTAKDELDLIRRKKTLRRLLGSVKWLIEVPEITDDEAPNDPVLQSGWVYTGYERKEDHAATVTFKPVTVNTLAQQFLWSKAQKFLVMSASFVGADETAAELGLEDGEWTVITMPSTFPPLRRPIIPVDVTSVTNKTKETAYPIIARSIEKVLDRHPDERVLIHTVSYDLGKQMMDHLMRTKHRGRLVTYYSADNREGALRRYLNDERGVLLAPSFDRGVDLPKDDCRVIVVPKVPYGNLGDKQISTRFYGTGRAGKLWYKRRAIQNLCQMTGRGMRSADDYCVTYVLDSEFSKLYQENRRMFPKWWAEAIVWDGYDPKWKSLTVSAEGLK